jgi:hypothetical protein
MRFLGDMGVSRRVIEWLRSDGHDAIHLARKACNASLTATFFKRVLTNNGSS